MSTRVNTEKKRQAEQQWLRAATHLAEGNNKAVVVQTALEADCWTELSEAHHDFFLFMQVRLLLATEEKFSSLWQDPPETAKRINEFIDFDQSGIEDLYRKETSSYNLLNADQEKWLAQAVNAGKLAHELIESGDAFNPGLAKLLLETTEFGQNARKRLALANTRLVMSVAKKYRDKGLPLLDLVQEGNIGLLRAIDKYDWRLGNRFSTYATWWIRQAVVRALTDKGRTVRLPAHIYFEIRKFVMTEADLEQELSRTPTLEEVAAKLNVPIARAEELAKLNVLEPVSFSALVGGREEYYDSIEDSVYDPDDLSVEHMTGQHIGGLDIQKAMRILTKRELIVLVLKFEHDLTLKEIGEYFDLSRERVRQIIREAAVKLKPIVSDTRL